MLEGGGSFKNLCLRGNLLSWPIETKFLMYVNSLDLGFNRKNLCLREGRINDNLPF